jgi:mannose-6-phosphate isomerase-like protein (cupin superfamily)
MKKIIHNGILIAIIIKSNYCCREGVEFFTDGNSSQQLALMSHKKGKIINAHVHNLVKREVHYTREVLLIKRGRLRVDFYDNSRYYLESVVLEEGDMILLSDGGHGFHVMEDCQMVEIKQGPYSGEKDKVRFPGVAESELIVKNMD